METSGEVEAEVEVEPVAMDGESSSVEELGLAQELDELRQHKELARHEVFAMEREVEAISRRSGIRTRFKPEQRRSPATKFFGLAQSGSRSFGQETGYAPQPTVQSKVTMVDEEEDEDEGRRSRRGRDRSLSRSVSGKRKRKRSRSPSPKNPEQSPAESILSRKKRMRQAREAQKKTKGLVQRNQRFFERALCGHLMAAIRDNKKRDKSRKHSMRKKASKLLVKQKIQVEESHKEMLQRKLLVKRKENEAIQAHFNWQIQLKQNKLLRKKLKANYKRLAKFCWTSASEETSICWQPASIKGKEEVFLRLLKKTNERLLKDYEAEARHIKENEPEEPPLPASVIEQRAAEKKRLKELETARVSEKMNVDEVEESASPPNHKKKVEVEIEADFPSADEDDVLSKSPVKQPGKSSSGAKDDND